MGTSKSNPGVDWVVSEIITCCFLSIGITSALGVDQRVHDLKNFERETEMETTDRGIERETVIVKETETGIIHSNSTSKT